MVKKIRLYGKISGNVQLLLRQVQFGPCKIIVFDFGKDFCLKRDVYCFLGGLKGRKKLKATVIVLRVNLVILQSGFDWLWGSD